jgi:hypothetical protein
MHEREFQVRKSSLTDRQMSDVAYVDQAAQWSKDLTRMRARGSGDTDNAMRDIARDYGLDYWALWRLRYRRQQIKDIGVTLYMRLLNAYQNECQRQAARLSHEQRIAEQIAYSVLACSQADRELVDNAAEAPSVQQNVSEA